MSRRVSRRKRDAAARRRSIEGPPPYREADARAASLRQANQRRPTIDRGSVDCGWCGATTPVPSRGRIPKWCSAACRHRAWEQRRAAESGLSAIEVVDRPVEVVHTITRIKRVSVDPPPLAHPRTVEEWTRMLCALASGVDRGVIYDRQLAEMRPAVAALVDAFNRRRA